MASPLIFEHSQPLTLHEVNRQYALLKKQGLLNTSNNDDILLEAIDETNRGEPSDALMRLMRAKKGANSNERLLPSISGRQKGRVNSSGATGGYQRRSMASGETPKGADPFTRVNKFKNVGIAQGISKPRYSQ
jgi:hypothetical protein